MAQNPDCRRLGIFPRKGIENSADIVVMTVAQKSKTNLQLNPCRGPDSEGALSWPMVHILWEHNFLLQVTQRAHGETALSMPATWERAVTSQGTDLE